MANKLKICDMEIKYDVAYRDIKHPRLEFKTGDLLVVLPKGLNKDKFIQKHKDWIYRSNKEILNALYLSRSKQLSQRDEEEFRELVESYIADTLEVEKFDLNMISFRRMKSKWASCSARKNLTINTFLKFLPEELIEYVVYHEMMHLRERKHNERFWKLIKRKFPKYEDMEKELFRYWFLIQKKIA